MPAAEIVMPRLSDTMEEGTILSWLVADGETVKRGQELVEIETDKANMTYESDQEGVLQTIAAEGDTLPVGAPIARVGTDDRRATDSKANKSNDEPAFRPAGVRAVSENPDGDVSPIAPASQKVVGAQETQGGERLRASPVARRIARENDIDLNTLSGSGPGGRIVKADVQGAAAGAPSTAGSSPATDATVTPSAGTPPSGTDSTSGVARSSPDPGTTAPPPAGQAGVSTAKGETTIIELSRTQQTIARRMAEAKATIPEFTLQAEIDMEACVALRSELKKLGQADAPTYNDMVVKACALALRENPRANGGYRDGRVQLHSRVNVGVAVAAEETLVVPTVFDSDQKSLGEIARETRALAERVRDGSITPPELGGGTFTVSNLGMFGVASFIAIINSPQAAILSVGSLQPRAVVRNGELEARNTMTVTLACDHRILYGADAAQFLARIRELLEAPAALTL